MRLIPVVVVKRAQGGSSLRVRRFRWRRRINRRRLRLRHFAESGRAPLSDELHRVRE